LAGHERRSRARRSDGRDRAVSVRDVGDLSSSLGSAQYSVQYGRADVELDAHAILQPNRAGQGLVRGNAKFTGPQRHARAHAIALAHTDDEQRPLDAEHRQLAIDAHTLAVELDAA